MPQTNSSLRRTRCFYSGRYGVMSLALVTTDLSKSPLVLNWRSEKECQCLLVNVGDRCVSLVVITFENRCLYSRRCSSRHGQFDAKLMQEIFPWIFQFDLHQVLALIIFILWYGPYWSDMFHLSHIQVCQTSYDYNLCKEVMKRNEVQLRLMAIQKTKDAILIYQCS